MSHRRIISISEPGGDGPHNHSWVEECTGRYHDAAAVARWTKALRETEEIPFAEWERRSNRGLGYDPHKVRDQTVGKLRERVAELEHGACPICGDFPAGALLPEHLHGAILDAEDPTRWPED